MAKKALQWIEAPLFYTRTDKAIHAQMRLHLLSPEPRANYLL